MPPLIPENRIGLDLSIDHAKGGFLVTDIRIL